MLRQGNTIPMVYAAFMNSKSYFLYINIYKFIFIVYNFY